MHAVGRNTLCFIEFRVLHILLASLTLQLVLVIHKKDVVERSSFFLSRILSLQDPGGI